MKIKYEKTELPTPMPFYLKIPLMKSYWDRQEVFQFLKIFFGFHVNAEIVKDMAKKMFHSKYVVAINKGRSASYLGMRALGLKEGDEVICPSFFCRTVAQAILQVGCTPVYADIDEDFNINPKSIERCITKKVKAIIMTHMFGKLAQVDEIQKIARKYNLFLIDNAAVVAGAVCNNRFAGTLGDFGFTSFGIGKQMNATGGSILFTDSDTIYNYILSVPLGYISFKKQINQIFYSLAYFQFKQFIAPFINLKRGVRNKTIPEYYRERDRIPKEMKGRLEMPEEFKRTNRSILFEQIIPARMSSVESSLASVQLRKLEKINQRTSRNAGLLTAHLKDVKEITLPRGVYPEHVFTFYTIVVNERSRYELSLFLAKRGIETQWTFYPLHLQEKFNHYRRDDLHVTEKMWRRVLSLPMGAHLTENQIRYIADSVKDFFSKG